MRAAKVGLLLAILAFGAAVEATWFFHREFAFGPVGCRVLRGRFYGPSFSFDEDARMELPSAAGLEVNNAFGAVRVLKGEQGEARITLRKVVFQQSEAQAGAFASSIRLQTTLSSSLLRVSTNRHELESGRAGRDVGFETHLEIAVPPETSVTVRNEHGTVQVADVAQVDASTSFDSLLVERVTGHARVTGRHGDVAVSGVGGALDLSTQHGDSDVRDVSGHTSIEVEHGDVTIARVAGLKLDVAHGDVALEAIRGDATLRGRHAPVRGRDFLGSVVVETSHGDVEIDAVKGDARVRAEHGQVSVTNAAGAVSVSTSFKDVTLSRIAGVVEVDVTHGGMKGQGLEKGGRIKVQGDDVTLEGFSGAVFVEAQRGSIELAPEGALKEAITASTTFGSIDLLVPAGSRFDLEAEAREGDVEVDLPGLKVAESSEKRVRGTYDAGGIPVKLLADRGDVRIGAAGNVPRATQQRQGAED